MGIEDHSTYRSLESILLGRYLTEEGLSVVYNPGLAGTRYSDLVEIHEGVHQFLITHSVFGNFQQLLARLLNEPCFTPLENSLLRDAHTRLCDESRLIQEAVATYAALSYGEVRNHPYVKQMRSDLGPFYRRALAEVERVFIKLELLPDSYWVLSQELGRAALNTNIYNDFQDISQFFRTDLGQYFERCGSSPNRRFKRLLQHFSDKRTQESFCEAYNTFIKQNFAVVHGVEYHADMEQRARALDWKKRELLATLDRDYVYRFLSRSIPDIDINNPDEPPRINRLIDGWYAQLCRRKKKAFKKFRFNLIDYPQLLSNVTYKPHPAAADNCYEIRNLDRFLRAHERKQILIVTRFWHHDADIPHCLSERERKYLNKGDSYFSYSFVSHLDGGSLQFRGVRRYNIVSKTDLESYLGKVLGTEVTLIINEDWLEPNSAVLLGHDLSAREVASYALIYWNNLRGIAEFVERNSTALKYWGLFRLTPIEVNYAIFWGSCEKIIYFTPVSALVIGAADRLGLLNHMKRVDHLKDLPLSESDERRLVNALAYVLVGF